MEFPGKLAVLTDGTDFTLVFSSPGIASEISQFQRTGTTDRQDKEPAGGEAKKAVELPGKLHVGFRQDSREAVDEIYKQLKANGVEAEQPKDYHGAWTFFVRATGGYFVEVFYQARRGDGR